MKKIIALVLSFVLLLVISGCSQPNKQSENIKAYDGYFDITAEEFLTQLNANIKTGNSEYPQLPKYSDKQKLGELTEYCSYFDNGAYLRVDENQSNKLVCITLLLDITKATEKGANYSGYYLAKVADTINPNSNDFKSLKFGNLAVDNVQSTSNGNIYCVVVNENGVQQCRIYPLTTN